MAALKRSCKGGRGKETALTMACGSSWHAHSHRLSGDVKGVRICSRILPSVMSVTKHLAKWPVAGWGWEDSEGVSR